jgi:lipopolysaccharide biosynthesis protein
MTSLALMAHYNTAPDIDANLVLYLQELSAHFDTVLVLTNPRPIATALPPRCVLVFVPHNIGLDFGKWMFALKNLPMGPIDRLGLFNDSVFLVNDLRPSFDQARARGWEFWGMTASDELARHLQSYFLVADTPAACDRVLEFFKSNAKGMEAMPKLDIIRKFEVGLSEFMARSHKLEALFKPEDILRHAKPRWPATNNIAAGYWDILFHKGCPVLKKARLRLPHTLRLEAKYGATIALQEFNAKVYTTA